MFDLFSMFGDLKTKAKDFMTRSSDYRLPIQDKEQKYVNCIFNGQKHLLDLKLSDEFHSLDKSKQEEVLLNTIKEGLNQSQNYVLKELKDIVPNIPGLNLFG
ncbi:MAG: hypothetical protein MUE53_00185 [Chitinophagales bacterium]|jgi:DNA-binding protein YbaB|nr:hypothetical protein [Chitinophagales bacterium]